MNLYGVVIFLFWVCSSVILSKLWVNFYGICGIISRHWFKKQGSVRLLKTSKKIYHCVYYCICEIGIHSRCTIMLMCDKMMAPLTYTK